MAQEHVIDEHNHNKEPYKIMTTDHGSINKFYLGDCIDGIKNGLKNCDIDVVVTSPPYNIGKNYSVYKDLLLRKEYLTWIKEVSLEIKRVLKNDGSFFINVGNNQQTNGLHGM